MALLPVQQVAPTGTAVSLVAASAGGDKFQPGATTYLRVNNGSGASITVTVTSFALCSQGVQHDRVVTVPAGVGRDIGPFPAERYASPTDQLAAVSYSGVTSLTIGAISV